jgi:hypothetical protein
LPTLTETNARRPFRQIKIFIGAGFAANRQAAEKDARWTDTSFLT